MTVSLSILGREILRFGKTPAPAGSFAVSAGSPMSGLLSGLRSSGSWGYAQEANKAARLAAYTGYVHTCVSTRAMRDAKAKFMLYDSRDPSTPVPVEKLPVPYAFFRDPNPVMSEYQLSMLVRIWLMLAGTAPLLKIRNAAGVPVGCWPLLPSRVRALYDAETWVRYEYQDDAGQTIKIPGKDMIYIRKPHPTKMFDGLGDLEGAGLFHDTDMLLWQFQRELFDKGPFSSWVLQYPEAVRLTSDQVSAISDGFEDIVGDRTSTARPVVLDSGVEAKSFPVTNKGLEVPTINEEIKERIRCAFGTSKSILGEVEMASRANNEGAEISYSKRTDADNQLIADAYALSLLPEYGNGDRLVGAFEQLAPEDKEFRLRTHQAMAAGGAITVNEWRGAEGFQPVEGGDELMGQMEPVPDAPDGTEIDGQGDAASEVPVTADVQAQALNGAQVDSLAGILDKVASGAMSKPTAAAFISIAFPSVTPEQIAALLAGIEVKAPEEEEDPEDEPPEDTPEGDAEGDQALRLEADPAAVRLAKSRAFIAFQGKHEAKVLAALQPILKAERDAILKRIEARVPKVMSLIAGCATKKHARVILKDSTDIDAITDMDEFAEEYEKLNPFLVQLYTEAGQKAAAGYGVEFVVNAKGITKIANHLKKSTDSILQTTAELIRAALEEGFLEGEGVDALAGRIRDLYEGISRGRALTIARTETVAPANFGAIEGYKQAGVEKKEWIATEDELTRDTHAALNGKVIGIDEEFSVGNDRMLYPGGGNEAGENINCRCAVAGVMEEE